MDWPALFRSRWVIGVCLLAVAVGGIAVVDDVPGGDRLPGWDRLSPSLELEESEAEALVHEGINEARAERNLTRLSNTATLTAVARNHSQDMADRGYFDHMTPDGVGPAERVERAGVSCRAVSENIARLPRQNHEEPLAETAVESWLNSAGHLMNIVAENWSRTGVGVVAEEDTVYITQVFCS